MRDIRKELVEMLKVEVKLVVGCIELVVLVLVCVKVKELLGEEIVENCMLVSFSIYKNGMCVGILGIERLGLKIVVVLGIVGGYFENGLSVLEILIKEEVKIVEDYMDNILLLIIFVDIREKVFIEVVLKGKNYIVKVRIRIKYDNFMFLEKDGEVLLDNELKVLVLNDVVEKVESLMDIVII